MPDRGDVLLVPFPFTDLSASKRRPVLALTAADSFGDFVALPSTSRPQSHNAVSVSSSEMVSGSLPVASWVRTNRIVTLNESLVVKALGKVSSRIVADATHAICTYIGSAGTP